MFRLIRYLKSIYNRLNPEMNCTGDNCYFSWYCKNEKKIRGCKQ